MIMAGKSADLKHKLYRYIEAKGGIFHLIRY